MTHPAVWDKGWIKAGEYEIAVAGERAKATASLRAPYDPKNRRLRYEHDTDDATSA